MQKAVDYKKALENVFQIVSQEENTGKVADYIPELAKINPEKFGVHFLSVENEEYGLGDWQTKFSIQSISKVLSLSLIYKKLGAKIWERVRVEPSGNAFNSLVQLEADTGIPRNPFINGGAIVICDMLISNFQNPKKEFLEYVRKLSSCQDINYSEAIAKSEASVGYRNVAVCNLIKSFGNLENEPVEVLDFYFTMCSVEMTAQQLSKTFQFLTNSNFTTADGKRVLTLSRTKRLNAIMQTCGFYDESGEFAFKVGLPGKSGVGGGIVAVHPGEYCISVWSPRLNKKGNSARGMKFLELFTTETKLSIF